MSILDARYFHLFQRVGRPLAAGLLRPPCVVCRRDLDDLQRPLCHRCFEHLRLPGSLLCSICGRPLKPGEISDAFLCPSCDQKPPDYQELRAADSFGRVGRRLVHALKFEKRLDVLPVMVERLTAGYYRYFEERDIDVIIPIPLHPWRRFWRGFNQSELLAEGLSTALALPLDVESLARIKNTKQQVFLATSSRRKNLNRAFAVMRPSAVKGRTILLIDDVATTGTTLHEAARTLLESEARAVYALVFSRAAV